MEKQQGIRQKSMVRKIVITILLATTIHAAAAAQTKKISVGAGIGIQGISVGLATKLNGNLQLRADITGHVNIPIEFTYEPFHIPVKIETGKYKALNILLDYFTKKGKPFYLTAGMAIGNGYVAKTYNTSPFLKQADWEKELIIVDGTMITTDDKGIVSAKVRTNAPMPYAGCGIEKKVFRNKARIQADFGILYSGGFTIWTKGKTLQDLQTERNVQIKSGDVFSIDKRMIDTIGRIPVIPTVKMTIYIN